MFELCCLSDIWAAAQEGLDQIYWQPSPESGEQNQNLNLQIQNCFFLSSATMKSKPNSWSCTQWTHSEVNDFIRLSPDQLDNTNIYNLGFYTEKILELINFIQFQIERLTTDEVEQLTLLYQRKSQLETEQCYQFQFEHQITLNRVNLAKCMSVRGKTLNILLKSTPAYCVYIIR